VTGPRRPEVLYLAQVEWVDSVGGSEWQDPDEAIANLDHIGAHAVGQVIADDERGIVMVLSVGDAGIVLSSMAIPRQCIVSIQKLSATKTK
jgi:hypothetical protein